MPIVEANRTFPRVTTIHMSKMPGMRPRNRALRADQQFCVTHAQTRYLEQVHLGRRYFVWGLMKISLQVDILAYPVQRLLIDKNLGSNRFHASPAVERLKAENLTGHSRLPSHECSSSTYIAALHGTALQQPLHESLRDLPTVQSLKQHLAGLGFTKCKGALDMHLS